MSERKWIADRIARVRDARRRQGHELRRLQEGIVAAVAEWDPAHDPASRKELDAIEIAVRDHGKWTEHEEWRISTSFESTITRTKRDGADMFGVMVDCDGQKLGCTCPTLRGAYAFMRLYQALIVDQFYTIGPPWARTGIFET